MMIKMQRREFLALTATTSFGAFAADAAYPDKPIKWLVGYPAGGGSDFLARTVGAQMSEQMRQPVIIDNRPGAAGMIGAEAAVKSPADGYTLFTADNGILIYNPVLYKRVPYNADRDFAPLGLIARVPLVLVAAPKSGLASLQAAIAAMRANPAKYSYASPGSGSPHHLAMELFKQNAGVFVLHIPFRGAAPALQDVMGGQVSTMVVDTSTAMAHIKAGKLVPLMAFSDRRLAQLPDVPTAKEAGLKDVEAYAWQGLMVPAATPGPVRERLAREMRTALNNPGVLKKLAEAGWEPISSDPLRMTAYIESEKARWHKLIKDRNITLE